MRMMQSVLGPTCMLMGRATEAVPTENQGSALGARVTPARAGQDKQSEWRVRRPANRGSGCLRKMMMMAVMLDVGAT